MTEQSNAELIAEAITRAELCDADSREAMRDTGRIILRLTDALEAADLLAETVGEQRDELSRMHRECHEQRNHLAAVVEKAEDFVTRHYLDTRFGDEVLPILASAGADVLREHDAKVRTERDALAAVMEKARLYCENQGDKFRHHAGRILDMLAASPADALREVKADAWDEGHSWGWSDAQDAHDVRQEMKRSEWRLSTSNPYRAREEQA